VILFAMAIGCLALWIGRIWHTCDLDGWLGLNPNAFWQGHLWMVVTYPLIPAGVLDFLFNILLIGWFGSCVETAWSRWELWTYCLLTVAAGGTAKLLFARLDASTMVGATPIVFGLMVAWMRLRRHERVQVMLLGETTTLVMGLVMLAASSVFLWMSSGLVNAVVMLAGALSGWTYLSIRWKWNLAVEGQQVGSERMRRLEL